MTLEPSTITLTVEMFQCHFFKFQDVAFGFFDDLSIEEKDRVTYILYGPKVTDTDVSILVYVSSFLHVGCHVDCINLKIIYSGPPDLNRHLN